MLLGRSGTNPINTASEGEKKPEKLSSEAMEGQNAEASVCIAEHARETSGETDQEMSRVLKRDA